MRNDSRTLRPWMLVLVTVTLIGCAPTGPIHHPVVGRIELKGGDLAHLAGSTLEVASIRDPSIRASGEIQPDGRFELESLHAGELRRGVREGEYTARIIPNDEDTPTRKRAEKAIAARYLKFETSKVSVQVPPAGELTVNLSAR